MIDFCCYIGYNVTRLKTEVTNERIEKMKQRYQGRKINRAKNQEYQFTVIAESDEEAKEAALAEMRNPEGFKIIIEATKPLVTFSADEDFANRTGLTPMQYEHE